MINCNFIMQKIGECFKPYGPEQERLYSAWLSGLSDGQLIDLSARKHRPSKTLSQLGYWYGVLMPFAAGELRNAGHDELFEVSVGSLKTGVETNATTTDLLFKTLYMAAKSEKRFPLKRNMSDEEMSQLIDFTLEWLAKNLGVTAPLPVRGGSEKVESAGKNARKEIKNERD